MIEQTKSLPQGTLEFQMKKQMEFFSFNFTLTLSEEGKWLLAVNSSETTTSVFNIIDNNNSFSIATPGFWSSRSGVLNIHELQKLIELRSQNDIKLHVEKIS